MDRTMDENETNYWYQFRAALASRSKDPWGHPSFVMFFFVGVLFFGGLGIWVEIVRVSVLLSDEASFKTICFAINVFYPSLGCASMLQFILGDYPKMLRALGVLLCFIFVVACGSIGFLQLYTPFGLVVEIILSALALWCWWIANAKNPDFLEPDPTAASGPADVSTPLSGTLDGFKV
ncbi:hypothetical protein PS708_03460 [Pseudomonas fluorescens]|nr:hypothetical protein PS708_03460 [Pseudomonas fluorescens]